MSVGSDFCIRLHQCKRDSGGSGLKLIRLIRTDSD
jgi:hypothetical protein